MNTRSILINGSDGGSPLFQIHIPISQKMYPISSATVTLCILLVFFMVIYTYAKIRKFELKKVFFILFYPKIQGRKILIFFFFGFIVSICAYGSISCT